MTQALVTLPARIMRGEVITVRALVQHPMETGYRRDAGGTLLARDLVRRFACVLDDGRTRTPVFSAEFHAAIAANPFVAFPLRADRDGVLECEWTGDRGFVHRERVVLKVSA